MEQLLLCLDNIKVRKALNFLHFDEVMVFGLTGSCKSFPLINLGPLAGPKLVLGLGLGFKMYRYFKLCCQIGALVRMSLFTYNNVVALISSFF